MRKIILTVFALLCLVFPGVGFAESGDQIIRVYIYHDYYVPYIQGMDNVYGGYRVILSMGEQNVSVLGLRKTAYPGDFGEGTENLLPDKLTEDMSSYYDARNVVRDDVFIFTEIPEKPDSVVVERYMSGRYEYIVTHSYYYEYPVAAAGYTIDMNPVYGSTAVDQNGAPWAVALDESIMKTYMPEFSRNMLMPNFNGASPRGYIVKSSPAPGPYLRQPLSKGHAVYEGTGEDTSQGFRGRRGGRFKHILSLDPSNEENIDFVGWWNIFAQSVLAGVEDLRANLDQVKDSKQSYDNTIPPPSANATEADIKEYKMLTDTSSASIYFQPSDFNNYKFGEKLIYTGKPGNLWYFSGYPGYKAAYDLWHQKSVQIREEIEQGRSAGCPNVTGLALASMATSTPGLWNLPRADQMENASAYIYSHDPDMLGIYPFAKAVADLYYRGKYKSPVMTDAAAGRSPDPYRSLSAFLGRTISKGTNFTGTFRSKVSSAPFKGALAQSGNIEGWTEPWLPTQQPDGSIWAYWYNKDLPLYRQAVASSSIRLGTSVSGIEGVTAWNKGVENRRAQKIVMRRVTDIDRRGGNALNYGVQKQRELKGRSVADESNYVTYAGETRRNSVDYVKTLKAAKESDFGKVELYGTDAIAFAYNPSVKYFPVHAVGGMNAITRSFPYIGKLIKSPDYGRTAEVLKTFPYDSAKAAGLDLKPPVWDMMFGK